MTELFNHAPRQDLEWTPPAPLHVAQIKSALALYRETENQRDVTRNPTVSEEV